MSPTKLTTAEELLVSALPHKRCELVRGRLVVREPADGRHGATPISLVRITADGRVGRDPLEYIRYDLQTNSPVRLAPGLGQEWVDGADGPYALPFGKDELSLADGAFLVVGDNGSSVLRYYDLQGHWLVFDNDGALRCRVEMPSRSSVLEIGADYFLGRQRNDLDDESVVLFDLTRNY